MRIPCSREHLSKRLQRLATQRRRASVAHPGSERDTRCHHGGNCGKEIAVWDVKSQALAFRSTRAWRGASSAVGLRERRGVAPGEEPRQNGRATLRGLHDCQMVWWVGRLVDLQNVCGVKEDRRGWAQRRNDDRRTRLALKVATALSLQRNLSPTKSLVRGAVSPDDNAGSGRKVAAERRQSSCTGEASSNGFRLPGSAAREPRISRSPDVARAAA